MLLVSEPTEGRSCHEDSEVTYVSHLRECYSFREEAQTQPLWYYEERSAENREVLESHEHRHNRLHGIKHRTIEMFHLETFGGLPEAGGHDHLQGQAAETQREI